MQLDKGVNSKVSNKLAPWRRECSTRCGIWVDGWPCWADVWLWRWLLLQLDNLWVSIEDRFGGGNDADYARCHRTFAKEKNVGTPLAIKCVLFCTLVRIMFSPTRWFARRHFLKDRLPASSNKLTLINFRLEELTDRVKHANSRLFWWMLFRSF